MNNNGVYSISSYDSELNISEDFKWLWDSDESEMWKKKKKKKKKDKKKKKAKKKEKAKKKKKAKKKEKAKKKKRAKKKAKQLQMEFKYRLIEKSADVTLGIISDFSRMYAQNKFLQSESNK